MRQILLVTAREYRRMIGLPAFWIVLLIVPLIAAAASLARNLFDKSQTIGYVLVDKSGHYTAQVDRRVDVDYQRQVLVALLLYVQQWRVGTAAAEIKTPLSESHSSDAEVRNFMAAGGAPAVLRRLKPRLQPSAPPFRMPRRPFVEVAPPNGVVTDTANRFAASIGPRLGEMAKTAEGKIRLGVAIYIPDNVNLGGQVYVWTDGAGVATLVQDLRLELTQGLRSKALLAAGVDPLSTARIENLSVPISISPPQTSPSGSQAAIHSGVPLMLADLLLISMLITGSMMLQGLVEERSNNLLEAVLACVSPRELMLGKLLGISAIGLSIVGAWVGATIGVVHAVPSSPLGFLLPALASLAKAPWTAAAMVFYFLAGYLTIGMIFLGVGAISDSIQEAQTYLIPLMLLIAGPAVGLAILISRDPNGLVPRIFSWIPLYTPLLMLARLESGVSVFEIFGTAAVLLVFGALELFLLGWLFENHLIKTGRSLPLAGKAGSTAFLRAMLIVIAALVVVFVVRRNRTSAPGPESDQTALRARGESVFKAACANCHEPAVERAPTREQLASFTPERIVETLTSGSMQPMATGLDDADIQAVAAYLTGRHSIASSATAADPPPCSKPDTFSMSGAHWNGWGTGPRNWRFQSDPGLAVPDIPRLKVKWAFSYVGGKYGQPTLVGGRVFLTSTGGAVYSLDARTGCMFWRFAQSAPSRTTVSVGPAPNIAPSGYAAYFGDLSANVYAVDAASGTLLWKTRVDSHPRAVLTGSPTLFKDRLYVPVSSWEEGVASVAHYSCCTFRGSVVALDIATRKSIWKTFAIEQPPEPAGKNSAGTQMYGPAGAAVWSAPTIDAKRNRLYFATGNSYTDVVEKGSDAVIALDLASGRIVWRRQLIQGDNNLSGCGPGRHLVNCPKALGDDYDFGASPILLTLSTGKDVVLAGQKSGMVLGIDPDAGNILWRTQVGVGGFLGGVEWVMATDGARLYVANTDVLTAERGRPALFALDPATGKDLWYAPSPDVPCAWANILPCFNAQSAAPSVIPGVIIAGATDGHERAFAAADGRILWDFDTAGGAYRTINGVGNQPGGPIDVNSGTIADGMLFVMSGYLGNLGGGSNNVLLAFSVDGR